MGDFLRDAHRVLPFTGRHHIQLMYQRVHEPAQAPKMVIPDLPPYLSRIWPEKCLEKEPAKSLPENAGEILADLSLSMRLTHTRTVQITLPIVSKKAC